MCSDVINAFRWFESGQVALRIGADPPYNLIQGLEVYQAALNEARSDRMDRERARNKSGAGQRGK